MIRRLLLAVLRAHGLASKGSSGAALNRALDEVIEMARKGAKRAQIAAHLRAAYTGSPWIALLIQLLPILITLLQSIFRRKRDAEPDQP